MKLLLSIVLLINCISVAAQQKTTAPVSGKPGALGADYPKYLSASRDAYKKSDLEDTHYNLMLTLQQLDMKIGEEILKILPENMDSLKGNKANDNVAAMTGTVIGTTIHRDYGLTNKLEVDVMSNSPLVAMLNGFINNPLLANMGGRKAMKVDGYKGSYTYEVREQTDAAGKITSVPVAEMQIPVSSSLVTIKSTGLSEDVFVKLMNTVPVSKIAELLK
jgi:hypothetical protein